MIDASEISEIIADLESDRIERKQALSDLDRIQQAICAFANDLPDHRTPGYILIGVTDNGQLMNAPVTDDLLLRLAHLRDTGKILPIPHMEVEKVDLANGSLAVVKVHVDDAPPVRFEGRIWIRVGPRRAIASAQEELALTERRIGRAKPFDRRPCEGSSIDDLLIDMFKHEYLPAVVSQDVVEANHRETREQLASLRLFDLQKNVPTIAGELLFGEDPLAFFPGAYVQFSRFDGVDLSSDVQDQRMLSGNLATQLRQLDELLPIQLHTSRSAVQGLRHENSVDYPLSAIRELVGNAIMHRQYEGTNAPTRLYWFRDRVEIQNPGGLYGQVTPQNYTRTNDYRNPTVAEAMKALGYVERFGVGIARTRAALEANGNPSAEFTFEPDFVAVVVRAKR